MAGGMRRGDGPALGERAAGAIAAPQARHCWADPPGHPGPWPGLVVEWRRDGAGSWEGRCIYVVEGLDPQGPRVIERWVPARCLTPVSS
jgi:hypothetical protein